ncbi:carbohydrate ABC transporter permease [Alcaligenes sp. RM2]|uniref:Carbohydrate ABC transporter permease n=1 Tax=Alcaligenes phenolicus TaxID=232846 RepID=A0ABV2BJR3_9BURK|nr:MULTISPECIES: carbohydrate ABC transporter permease [Alcaligenes]EKU28352.1 ABC transporter permease [Alcaligenes sp. HPC1271]ERI33214.1 ABC transporter permease [Alcaligenes sp. EGD-AK7]MCB4320668.1 carbohydrate ABC transporter permease [Alcaligenes sp. 13f]UUO11590.1 carbohydrate ABC transporter permease [Alcaligenes faecalis]HRO19751.1 carbohydrate ABC transporter permease [Alcaligenes phenolicus]
MNMDTVLTAPGRSLRLPSLDTVGAHALALLWIAPLLYACWAAFRDPSAALSFDWSAGWTFSNFAAAWDRAPWLRYIFNTTVLVLTILLGQFVLCTLAAYAFARFRFFGSQFLFMLLLLQLFILPEVLIVENYRMVALLGWTDTVWGMGVPYMASAFGVFLLRQAFKQVPRELEDAARLEGCSRLGVLWRVYVPLVKPVYLAYALVSVSTHWNNFLWPLVISSSDHTRPLTVGLSLFGAPESGVSISLISAATLMTILPLLLGFLLFQKQFMQAFLRAGIR